LLERLAPIERAVYVLREAFSHRHAEIAEILDISVSASQQHAHRARSRVRVARNVHTADRAAARRIAEAFVDAAASGRTERLVALLTDDTTAVFDGLGLTEHLLSYTVPEQIAAVVRAAFRPTPAKRRLAGGRPAIHADMVNGLPAVLATLGDKVVGLAVLETRGDKIASVVSIADTDRLGRLTERWRRVEHADPLIESW
ncbi:sigma factor-like helix-turn-helix DNA-binding protein, partial [Glycomyces tenuis]